MSFSVSSGIITQSGTDANLSGLSGLTGVTTYAWDNITYYNLGTSEIVINGTLSQDPDTEVIVFNPSDNSGPLITVNASGTYNYGKEYTSNGNTSYSSGCGIICSIADSSTGRAWDVASLGLLNMTGTINIKGGTISTTKPISISGGFNINPAAQSTVNIDNLRVFRPPSIDPSTRREVRFDDIKFDVLGEVNNLILDGFLLVHRNLPAVFKATLINSAIGQLASGPTSSLLTDLNTSDNLKNYDLGTDFLGGNGTSSPSLPKFYTVINASNGSGTRCMPKEGVGNTRQLGGAIIKKQVGFNFIDSSSNAIEGVKLYLIDTDNGYRKNANDQNHLADKIYTSTSDANGDTSMLEVTTAITNININGTSGWTPAHWDTTSFSNVYKVDRRGLDDSTDDIFSFKFISYIHTMSQSNQILKGIGQLEASWTLFDDVAITEQDKATVDAYTTLDDAYKLYDRAKSHLYDNFSGETELTLSRSGRQVVLGALDLIIDSAAASAYSLATALTIKSTTFTGGATATTGNVAFNTAAKPSGGTFDCDVYLNSGQDLSDVTINGNLRINTGANSILDFTNVIVTGSVYNDDANSTLTINATGGSSLTANDAGAGDGQTNVQNPVSFSFNVSPNITGYEWRVYSVPNKGTLAGSTELDGEEVATQNNQTYTYDYTGPFILAVQILAQPTHDYEEVVVYYDASSLPQSVTIDLDVDANN